MGTEVVTAAQCRCVALRTTHTVLAYQVSMVSAAIDRDSTILIYTSCNVC